MTDRLSEIDMYWKQKLYHDFPLEALKHKPDNVTFKEEYDYLLNVSMMQAIKECRLDGIVYNLLLDEEIDLNYFFSQCSDNNIIELIDDSIIHRTLPIYLDKYLPTLRDLAIIYGHIGVLEYLDSYHINISSNIDIDIISQAAINGNLEMLKWLNDMYNFRPSSVIADNAIISGNLKIVDWLATEFNIYPDSASVAYAIINDDYNMMEWLIDNITIDKNSANLAAALDKVDILKLLDDHNIYPTINGINDAAINGNIRTIEYLTDIGKYPSIEGINEAAANGQLIILDYLAEYGKFPNYRGATAAAANDYYYVLKWLIGHNIYPNTSGLDIAVANGSLDILKLCVENNIYPSCFGLVSAMTNKEHNIIEWIKINLESLYNECISEFNLDKKILDHSIQSSRGNTVLNNSGPQLSPSIGPMINVGLSKIRDINNQSSRSIDTDSNMDARFHF